MIRRIEDGDIADVRSRAAGSPRLRANRNLHPSFGDPVQRFLNAIEPGSYVRPHRHAGRDRWELVLAMAGRAVVLVFDDRGEVLERVEVAAEGPVRGAEVAAGVWHAVAALGSGTVLFELKPGPYSPLTDKDFAAWAPGEGEPGAARLEAWYRSAAPGERAPERFGATRLLRASGAGPGEGSDPERAVRMRPRRGGSGSSLARSGLALV